MAEPDGRAVGILLRAYWSCEGWREAPVAVPEDLAYAEAAGVMFDELVSKTHDELVGEVVEAVGNLTPEHVADGFLSSLTSRRLELRSALGSRTAHRERREVLSGRRSAG
jgi:hypothetical protein